METQIWYVIEKSQHLTQTILGNFTDFCEAADYLTGCLQEAEHLGLVYTYTLKGADDV